MKHAKSVAALSALLLGATHTGIAAADTPQSNYYAFDKIPPPEALCGEFDDDGLVPIGFGWDMGTVHGTNDWRSSAAGTSTVSVSFRTCEWKGTEHDYAFQCHGAYNKWDLQLVRGDAGWRDHYPFNTQECDDTIYGFEWDEYYDWSTWRIHYHLHYIGVGAPSATNCPDQRDDSRCKNDYKVYQFKASLK